MEKIVLASGNKHKIVEVKEILQGYDVVPMSDVGFDDDIAETGATFAENSMIKAAAIRQYLDKKNLPYMVLADDSGLCIEALNGEPGVYSARYSGGHGNTEANRQLVLKKLAGVSDRSAHFECAMTLIRADGKYIQVIGKSYGTILDEYRGSTDFGYDCIFYSTELNKSFGEATGDEKNSVSHRGRALQMLIDALRNNEWRD